MQATCSHKAYEYATYKGIYKELQEKAFSQEL